MAYGDGAFVITWGWGKPGKVQRSTDGVNWNTVIDGTTHADIAFGNGVFLTGKGRPYFSENNGITWSQVTVPSGYNQFYNVRAIGFGSWASGSNFYLFGDGDRLHGVPPSGATISTPTHPLGCGSYLSGSATSNTVVVTTHSDYNAGQGYVCRSIDGGETWERQDVSGVRTLSSVLWTGTEFVFWGDSARMYRSPDGTAWTSQALVADNFSQFPSFGAMARSDQGTFAMVNGNWRQWYEQQRFFRSTDGVHWQQLSTNNYVGSHPLNFMEFGYVDPSAEGCPAQ